MINKENIYIDSNGLQYTIVSVNAIDLSNHIKQVYATKYGIVDYDQFNFEKLSYRETKIVPTLAEKSIMLEQGFIVINSASNDCFSDDIILLDGFNRLLNGEVPNQNTFVKIYNNISIEDEIKFYYNLNTYKNYSYGKTSISHKDDTKEIKINSYFFERGLLLYLTLRTGIIWNDVTRSLLIKYFKSSGYPDLYNNRENVFDKMIFDNKYLFDDIKLIHKISLNENTMINAHIISMFGAIRAFEFFNVPLNDYAKMLDGVKLNDVFDYTLLNNFYDDALVKETNVKVLAMSDHNHFKPKTESAMFTHFLDSYFLPKYANKEVKVSDAVLKDTAKKEKDAHFKKYKVVVREKEAEEVFVIGSKYILTKYEPLSFETLEVTYAGIKTYKVENIYNPTQNKHTFVYNDKTVFTMRVGMFRLHSRKDPKVLTEAK